MHQDGFEYAWCRTITNIAQCQGVFLCLVQKNIMTVYQWALMFFQLDQMSHHKVGEIMNGSTKHAAPPSVGQIVRTLKTLEKLKKLFKKSDSSLKVRKCRPREGSYFSSGFKALLLKPHFLDRISSPRDSHLLHLSTYETRPLIL